MTIPKVPIEKVNKFPWAYSLMVLGGVIGILSTRLFDNSDKQLKDKNATIAYYKQLAATSEKRCDSAKLYWQDKYLAQVEYSVRQQRISDSTNAAILRKPNHDLTKAIKQR